jgi:hypothetical protein
MKMKGIGEISQPFREFHSLNTSLYIEALAKLLKPVKIVIPGKRSATRNPVPLGAGFKRLWIPAFAGITEWTTFASGSIFKNFII